MGTASAVSQVREEGSHGFGWRVESQKQQGSGAVNGQPKPHVYKTRSVIKCCATPAATRQVCALLQRQITSPNVRAQVISSISFFVKRPK
jgi:hypothetical protein